VKFANWLKDEIAIIQDEMAHSGPGALALAS
jgi:hypothetical protein